MTPFDDVRWQLVTVGVQLDAMMRWMSANYERIGVAALLALGIMMIQIERYAGIVLDAINRREDLRC